ncbi:DUF3533 domain-containing protein [Streptomyces sp. NPDC059740]|uniref:DUF3533 domain-containing protein n=1 Tax=Streptomyces sp. NPDC059740 TaxID=3346926 RepID=UPI00364A4019
MAKEDGRPRPAPEDRTSPPSLVRELRDAVTVRAVLLVFGVFVLTTLFIASYSGAFHSPRPQDVTLGVAAPGDAARQVAGRLDRLPGSPLDPRVVSGRGEAEQRVRHRSLDAALVVAPRGRTDELLVASGAGASLPGAVAEVVSRAEKAQGRTVRTVDVAPASSRDARGLSAFYLVVGWCVGGYLCAAILAISYGARPTTTTRAIIRVGALALYSLLTGLAGAVVIGPLVGALPGSVAALWGLGALVVFAVGATTLAFQGVAGIVGIGLAILVVVVAGNPSAGGAYPYPLLPPFWRAIGPALPPGAGTWSARSIAYFGDHGVAGPLWVLAGWAVGGTVVTLTAAALRTRRRRTHGRPATG